MFVNWELIETGIWLTFGGMIAIVFAMLVLIVLEIILAIILAIVFKYKNRKTIIKTEKQSEEPKENDKW